MKYNASFQRRVKWYLFVLPVMILFLSPDEVYAQPAGNAGWEVTPYAAYMFGGKLRGYRGELNIDNGFSYGLALSKAVAPGTWAEFQWNGMNTKGRLRDYVDISNDATYDMNINYYLLSATQYWRTGSDDVLPFGILGAGVSTHKMSNLSSTEFLREGTEVFFSMAFGLGAKLHISERIGIRIQGRMLMPVTFGGASLWCGTGGCGTGVYTTSSILQGDLGGGLIFRF